MYTLIIVEFVVLILVLWYEEWRIFRLRGWDWQGALSALITAPIITLFIIGIINICVNGSDKYDEYHYKDQPIASLINKGQGSVNGSFFLGCGSVNGSSKDYYVAYAPMEKGDLRIRVDAYETYVDETDSIQPIIKDYWIKKSYTGYESKWLFNSKAKSGEWKINHRTRKTVIVPTNTIYKEFSIKD